VNQDQDYKSTLNLPQTGFEMQAKLAEREPQRLARWQEEDLYAAVDAATADGDSFVFVDGPPYANGDIHIGHAVNKVLKDMILKSERLEGRQARFVPGWDCHGLPIELQVEKKFGKVGQKLDAPAFRAECRRYAEEQVARQRVDFERLGVLADWKHPYLTMHPAFEAGQLRVLADIAERGHVVRGFKPVHWCLDCGSSLAEAEVEYAGKTSTAVDVCFDALDAADVQRRFGIEPKDGDLQFVIWTTTPWTLPANRAICVNAEIEYALVRLREGRSLVLAADLVAAVLARAGLEAEVIATTRGAVLEGAKASHPFAERTVPLICGEHVTTESGTGLVHTAPGHGVDDFVVGRQYGLEVDNPVGGNGVFLPHTPLVAGEHVRKADARIVESLRESGHLLHAADFEHSYPHCWRHKTPLIFRATPQWFISMDAAGLREGALQAIAETQWIPAWGESRIREMVAGRPDWCISRQRTWGVPLALFVHRKTQQLHPDTPALLRRVADVMAEQGLEAWFGSRPADWGVDETEYEACPDTLDVWFDSGVVHRCAPLASGHAPAPDGIADLYLEGSDQHRGWFQSSLLTSVAMQGHAPYRSVLTHGFTVDEQGRKMSKSLGNVVPPQQVTRTLGADVLRLWVASSDYAGEIAISDQLLKRIGEAYRRIRNTLRFMLGNLHDFEPAMALAPEQLLPVDAWAIAEASRIQDLLASGFRKREFHAVYHRLHNYCVVDLGGLYLDLLKDRLYTTPTASQARRSAQTALWHISEALVRWITPILSFTADEAWEQLPGNREGSVFAQRWWAFPEIPAQDIDWPALRAVRSEVKKAIEAMRASGSLRGDLDAEVELYAEGALYETLRKLGPELRFWLITSDARVHQGQSDTAIMVSLEGGARLGVSVLKSSHEKCGRCWHRREDVGADSAHPALCGRCVVNVAGEGEQRRWI
jgi:isoleucyl-tRNA synthetase